MWGKVFSLGQRPIFVGVYPPKTDRQGAIPRGWCLSCGTEVFFPGGKADSTPDVYLPGAKRSGAAMRGTGFRAIQHLPQAGSGPAPLYNCSLRDSQLDIWAGIFLPFSTLCGNFL